MPIRNKPGMEMTSDDSEEDMDVKAHSWRIYAYTYTFAVAI